MQYRHYGIEDFVRDAYFQQWVLTPDEETNNFWNTWLDQNPDRRFMVKEARKIILLLGFSKDFRQNERLLETWKSLDEAWATHHQGQRKMNRVVVQAMRVAAVFVILVLSVATAWYFVNRKITIDTLYSEIKSVTLPDGSVIDLNANSRISYFDDWDEQNTREVWLEGEAFFSVAHNANKKFVVHTPEGIHVNVLGTTFNVKSRHNTTRVSLNTGKIEVNLDSKFLKANQDMADRGFVMLPGDVAEFDNKTSEIKRLTAKVEQYALWKERRIVFDNTSMQEVAALLQDTYGLTVTLDEPLAVRKITGEFRLDDLDILLQFIARALQVDVTRNSEKIHFGSGKVR